MDLKTQISRFEDKYTEEPNTGCFLWMGSIRGRMGYGGYRFQGKMKNAHQVSYILYKGEIPEGKIVCHTCNNPLCVNPNHLYAGTYSDNTRQAVAEGRQFVAAGEKNGQAKLTWTDVRAIRKDMRSQYAIAAAYGISQLHVSRIKRNISWKEIHNAA